jgi:DNA-binding GntR family transcriptional regulator
MWSDPMKKALEEFVTPSSMVDQVVDRLETAILNGELESGGRLSEQAIAAKMGISRGPLREALRRLEGRGLIERIPHIGARVTTLLAEQLEEILVIREALEPLACRLAAARVTDAELENIEAIWRSNAARSGEPRVFAQSPDQDFHLAIIMASGNQKLVTILRDDIYYLMRFHRYRSGGSPERAGNVADEHRAIVEGLRERSPEKAEAAMRRHLANAHSNIRSRFKG